MHRAGFAIERAPRRHLGSIADVRRQLFPTSKILPDAQSRKLVQGYARMIPRHQKLRDEFRQVSAAKQMAFDPRRGRGSDSRSPMKKLAAGSTGQHHNRSVIIPGAALRQSLTDIRRTTFDPSFVLILLASPRGFEACYRRERDAIWSERV